MIVERQVFVLGAPDPEMTRIESLLSGNGIPYEYATYNGERVNCRTAYVADAYVPNAELVFVEADMPGIMPAAIIDHHREGDPGYYLTERESLKASSLGQVCRMLHLIPTHEDMVLAAMDHNYAAALRGEAWGVTAQEVYELKMREVAKTAGESVHSVELLVNDFRRVVRQAGRLVLSEGIPLVLDLRGADLGYGYSFDLLAMQIAVVAEGSCALVANRESTTGPEKIMLTGHASPQQVKAFMDIWAPKEHLNNVYGVPPRGYAGGCRIAS